MTARGVCRLCGEEVQFTPGNPVELGFHMIDRHNSGNVGQYLVNSKCPGTLCKDKSQRNLCLNDLCGMKQGRQKRMGVVRSKSTGRHSSDGDTPIAKKCFCVPGEKMQNCKNPNCGEKSKLGKVKSSSTNRSPDNSRSEIHKKKHKKPSNAAMCGARPRACPNKPCKAYKTSNCRRKRYYYSRGLYKTTLEQWTVAGGYFKCPKCGENVQPLVRSQKNKIAYTSIGATFLLSCWPFCFLCPLMHKCSVDLYCPNCKYSLGSYDAGSGKTRLNNNVPNMNRRCQNY